jgi:HSP20 family protein
MAKNRQASGETSKQGAPRPLAPLHPLPTMFTWEREIDRLFDEFRRFAWPRVWSSEQREARGPLTVQAPPVDVYDLADEVVVRAELPGIAKEDVEVHISDSTLTLKAQKTREQHVEEQSYYRRECQYGSFLRSIQLPSEVQANAARASMENGVLEIRLRKSEVTKKKSVKVEVQ